jgi:hypothetical protein
MILKLAVSVIALCVLLFTVIVIAAFSGAGHPVHHHTVSSYSTFQQRLERENAEELRERNAEQVAADSNLEAYRTGVENRVERYKATH